MARYNFRASRLLVDTPLALGASVALDRGQANYLVNVLRLSPGEAVLLFNGRDGEWRAVLAVAARKSAVLDVVEQTRPQPDPANLHYLFAPLKHARLDYMVQKAVEMGAALLRPVLTRHTQAERVNLGRMQANAVEAAEQCGILNLPQIFAPTPLEELIAGWPAERLLVFCDEDAEVVDPVRALGRAERTAAPAVSVLIGPEGGFAAEERAALCRVPRVVRLALGPRILRADTAAVAALALVQSVLGDWR